MIFNQLYSKKRRLKTWKISSKLRVKSSNMISLITYKLSQRIMFQKTKNKMKSKRRKKVKVILCLIISSILYKYWFFLISPFRLCVRCHSSNMEQALQSLDLEKFGLLEWVMMERLLITLPTLILMQDTSVLSLKRYR